MVALGKVIKSRKTRLIVLVVIIFVAVGAGAYWYFNQADNAPVGDSEETMTPEEERHMALVNAAVQGDIEASNESLQAALEAANSDQERAEVYRLRAAHLYGDGSVAAELKEQALADAEKAYELDASLSASTLILMIADDIGRDDLVRIHRPLVERGQSELQTEYPRLEVTE